MARRHLDTGTGHYGCNHAAIDSKVRKLHGNCDTMDVTPFDRWYAVIGALLILLAVIGTYVRRQPVTTAMLYLGLGWLFGVLGWISLDSLQHRALLERLSEVAVIVSLFGAGLKLRLPLKEQRWRLPLALAFVSMAFTVAMIAGLSMWWLDLPLGAAVILGAVLAPTDPVLASDVQVSSAEDMDRVRFTLTGEAGMNDGTAFPFVMLGLGLLGLHELGPGNSRWLTIDVVWAIGGGLACGALLGIAVGRLVVFLRQTRHEAMGFDDFLAVGLIALAYGVALLLHTYGFLAVFAAGLALRMVERTLSGTDAPADVQGAAAPPEELASHPEYAPAYMAEAVLRFNEHFERVGELTVVLLIGSLMPSMTPINVPTMVFAALLFCLVRPLAVAPIAWLGGMNRMQTLLVSWFGIRGIGSIYYLFYALGHGVSESSADRMLSVTLWVVTLSICLHGISGTPLMRYYQRRYGETS